MKKVLIYRSIDALKPTGGPNGYLYCLKNGLDSYDCKDLQIDFLPVASNNGTLKNNVKSSTNAIILFLSRFYKRIKHIRFNLSVVDGKKIPPVDLNEYDAIHFHTTCDMHYVREYLTTYKGKVILSSHSPQPSANEFMESSSKLEMKVFGKRYKRMIESDEYAFRRADYIIFPCEYADEPYLNSWEKYKEIKQSSNDKYRFLLTGTVPAQIKRKREDIRKEYNIPDDAFVICYVGRHNEVKGYDQFIDICEKFLSENDNTYVLVAGNAGPLLPPKDNKKWIEVGWTNDPHSIIAASDTFILPNKDTYFDLIMLEVLSIGVPIIASYTGGNKFFEKYNYDGIRLYRTNNQCIEILYENMLLDALTKERIKKENMNLYQQNFTTGVFAKNYVKILREIVKED